MVRGPKHQSSVVFSIKSSVQWSCRGCSSRDEVSTGEEQDVQKLHTVQFLRVPCNKKLCLDKWHEILIGTIRQVRNAKKFEIPTTEI